MYIKSILAGAAIALVATVGSASAADHFTTLAGVSAQPLTVDAVVNAASDRFAALEGISAKPLTARELKSVAGRSGCEGPMGACVLAIIPPSGTDTGRFAIIVGTAIIAGVRGLSMSAVNETHDAWNCATC